VPSITVFYLLMSDNSPWQQASALYQHRLSAALNVHQHASLLAELPQTGLGKDTRNKLDEHYGPALRQLRRLESGTFRIAVVGLENAGKSTFVNAWLGCDLLPADHARCTYTPTQIFAVTSQNEELLEVVPKDENGLQVLIRELEAAGTENAAKDLAIIRSNEVSLKEVIRDGKRSFPFRNLEDIRDTLRKYVADVRFAHAVKEVRLYTRHLASIHGVAFYDVPGMDSGLAKTIEDNQEMLTDSDAVIIVQRDPSLKGTETKLVQMAVSGDNIPIARKLFVFLTRTDQIATAAALRSHIQVATESWKREAAVTLPSGRFVPGSAGAWLLMKVSDLTDKTATQLGKPAAMIARLEELYETKDPAALERATGIPVIKEAVTRYLDSERVEVLKDRCDQSIRAIIGTARHMREQVSARFSENPEDAVRQAHRERGRSFTAWWGDKTRGKWSEILAELHTYYLKNVMVERQDGAHTIGRFDKFANHYQQLINQGLAQLPSLQDAVRDRIFAATSDSTFDERTANVAWRENLFRDVCDLVEHVAEELALELREEADQLVGEMRRLLWNSQDVERFLVDERGRPSPALDQEYLQNTLKVLFLRFARPVANALVRAPVGSDTRNDIIRDLGADIELLDGYLPVEIDPALRQLRRFAKNGIDLLLNPQVRELVLGPVPAALPLKRLNSVITALQRAGDGAGSLPSATETLNRQRAVIREVVGDVEALQVFLLEAVFEASGFRSFCLVELQRLRDCFSSNGPQWSNLVRDEWQTGNPLLMNHLPPNLQTLETDTVVSDRLRNLAEALAKVDFTI
jgi:hypothetical protein